MIFTLGRIGKCLIDLTKQNALHILSKLKMHFDEVNIN